MTADVPSGSINSVSIARVARPGREAITTDAKPPTTTAMHAASAAKPSELTNASDAGTNSVSVDPLLPSARYAASDQLPPTRSDSTASTDERSAEEQRRGAEHAGRRPPARRPAAGAPVSRAATSRWVTARRSCIRASTSSKRDDGDHLHERERGGDRADRTAATPWR